MHDKLLAAAGKQYLEQNREVVASYVHVLTLLHGGIIREFGDIPLRRVMVFDAREETLPQMLALNSVIGQGVLTIGISHPSDTHHENLIAQHKAVMTTGRRGMQIFQEEDTRNLHTRGDVVYLFSPRASIDIEQVVEAAKPDGGIIAIGLKKGAENEEIYESLLTYLQGHSSQIDFRALPENFDERYEICVLQRKATL